MAVSYSRQNQNLDNNGDEVFVVDGRRSFWYSEKGALIRWAIFFGIILLFVVFCVLGRCLAARRLKKGQAPRKWNRWLLSRKQRAVHEERFRIPMPTYNNYRGGSSYGLHPMQQIPPMYNPNGSPPMYQPPDGAIKIDPSQTHVRPMGDGAPEYEAPAGPPPARTNDPRVQEPLEPNRTGGSTNPFRL